MTEIMKAYMRIKRAWLTTDKAHDYHHHTRGRKLGDPVLITICGAVLDDFVEVLP